MQDPVLYALTIDNEKIEGNSVNNLLNVASNTVELECQTSRLSDGRDAQAVYAVIIDDPSTSIEGIFSNAGLRKANLSSQDLLNYKITWTFQDGLDSDERLTCFPLPAGSNPANANDLLVIWEVYDVSSTQKEIYQKVIGIRIQYQ